MRTHFAFIIALASLLSCESAHETETVDVPPADVVLHTTLGDIGLHLYEETPAHRNNFLRLAKDGFFDSLTFSRVIHNFMIQSGDPRSRNATWQDSVMGPGYELPFEYNERFVHVRGAVAAARKGDEENPERRSSGSQFYLVTGNPTTPAILDSMESKATSVRRGQAYESYQTAIADSSFSGSFSSYLESIGFEPYQYLPEHRQTYLEVGGAPLLDFTYTVFGQVVSGLDVAMRISRQATHDNDLPVDPVRIDSVTVIHPLISTAPES